MTKLLSHYNPKSFGRCTLMIWLTVGERVDTRSLIETDK